ncbi:MAG: histone deacetylase family protein [Pseudomonadota bacterium]
MTLALFTHPASHGHRTPQGHPERVRRIEWVEEALQEIEGLDRREAPAAEEAFLRLGHPQAYVDRIKAAEPAEGFFSLDADTHMSPGSYAAALHAAGGCKAAVDAVLGGEVGKAFVATRPPGHHAEIAKPMGFCLFSNVALAALHAMEAHGLERVAIADFDVHHGNGTQALVEKDGRAAFASSQQMPLWPGTGGRDETGVGNVFNGPLEPGSGGPAFRALWERELLPALDAHAPQLVLVSAGFDAHRADPLAELHLEVEDFVWMTEALCDLAAAHAGGRLVSALEGGYDLAALAASAAAHVGVLKERAA